MGDVAMSIMWKLITPIISPLAECIKRRIERIFDQKKPKQIDLNGEYRDDHWVFRLNATLRVLAAGFLDGRIKCLEGTSEEKLQKCPPRFVALVGQTATATVKGVIQGVNIHLLTISIDNPELIVPASYLINLSLNRKTFSGTTLTLAPAADKGAVGWIGGKVTVRYADEDS